MKVYGPYTKKNGNKIIVIYSHGKTRTKTYARYLMEQHIGRNLTRDERIKFIDGDKTNCDISNLKIVKYHKGIFKEFVCPICGENFTKYGGDVKFALKNIAKGKAGPFCSQKCSRKHNKQHLLQWIK